MPYAGKQLMARDIAREARKYWRNYELTKAVATALGESAGYVGAWHDNLNDQGEVISRDCGVYQINIMAHDMGGPVEDSLRTDSLDPDLWRPVFEHNVSVANDLYNGPWQRDGYRDIRRWQPWYAYTLGWATFPYAWVWHRNSGEPIGPWVATGRYIFKAIAGQMNNLIVNEKLWTPEVALSYAKKYANHFGIQDGSTPYLTTDKLGHTIVSWHYAPKPTDPPADGSGPYPVPNDGV